MPDHVVLEFDRDQIAMLPFVLACRSSILQKRPLLDEVLLECKHGQTRKARSDDDGE